MIYSSISTELLFVSFNTRGVSVLKVKLEHGLKRCRKVCNIFIVNFNFFTCSIFVRKLKTCFKSCRDTILNTSKSIHRKHTATYKHMHKEEQSMHTQARLSLQHYIQINTPAFSCSLQDVSSP